MSEKAHAKLSASGAARWLNCPPSLHMEEQFPDTTSEYAEEGTLAHEIAELKLRKYFTVMTQRSYITAMNKLKKHKLYGEEMQEYTDNYLDNIKEVSHSFPTVPHCAIEKRVDFSGYVPDGFGTADCILIHGRAMWVIDFKYGKGIPVSARDNPQMKMYALGALYEYSMIYEIDVIHLGIVQPRLKNYSTWEITADELRSWGETIVAPAAQKALAGIGTATAGDHCRFCKAKATCRALAEENLALARHEFKRPDLLTDQEIGEVLKKAAALVNWSKAVEDYALKAVLEGKDIPGWKAVEGRSNRAFKNIDAAFAKLIAEGYDESLFYERKPVTLTATEKIIGKTLFDELLADDVEKPRGKPTLAPTEDKREPFGITSAREDFKEAI